MRNTLLLALLFSVVGAIVGIFGFIWVTGGSGEASAAISAPTLDPNAIPTLSAEQSFALATQSVAREAELLATIEAQRAVTSAPTLDPEAIPTLSAEQSFALATQSAAREAELLATIEAQRAVTSAPTATETPTTRILYRIIPAESEARFTLSEDLRGVPTEVIGRTSEVAGDIVIDTNTPALSQVGTIRINARTLTTDDANRNRAIRSRILRSAEDQYEFIEFAPTNLKLVVPSASVENDTPYPLEVTGGLKIIGNSLPVTFAGEAFLAEDGDLLRGEFSATVRYMDWGIAVPDLAFLANVDEEARLTLTFVAERVVE